MCCCLKLRGIAVQTGIQHAKQRVRPWAIVWNEKRSYFRLRHKIIIMQDRCDAEQELRNGKGKGNAKC